MSATIIQRNENEPENEDDIDTRYGLQKRAGLQPRKCCNKIPSKFREQAHTMFQIGIDFPTYSHVQADLYHNQNTKKYDLDNDPINHAIMTQYHVSKDLKVFGKEGTDAVMSELK
eukprot:11772998-Ditylum_brightwellii.AAC.1